MQVVTISATEEFVRNASRYVVGREYRPVLFALLTMISVGLALVLGLSATGFVANNTVWNIAIGLGAAAAALGVPLAVAYWQSLRFALLVYKNEGVREVEYKISEAGCVVRYKGVETLLRWDSLKMRGILGESEVLAFDLSDRSDGISGEVLKAMSHHRSGPQLLGFPVFCSAPQARNRYVFVPIELLRGHLIGAGGANS